MLSVWLNIPWTPPPPVMEMCSFVPRVQTVTCWLANVRVSVSIFPVSSIPPSWTLCAIKKDGKAAAISVTGSDQWEPHTHTRTHTHTHTHMLTHTHTSAQYQTITTVSFPALKWAFTYVVYERMAVCMAARYLAGSCEDAAGKSSEYLSKAGVLMLNHKYFNSVT